MKRDILWTVAVSATAELVIALFYCPLGTRVV